MDVIASDGQRHGHREPKGCFRRRRLPPDVPNPFHPGAAEAKINRYEHEAGAVSDGNVANDQSPAWLPSVFECGRRTRGMAGRP